jgi:hypothetical protein
MQVKPHGNRITPSKGVASALYGTIIQGQRGGMDIGIEVTQRLKVGQALIIGCDKRLERRGKRLAP